MAKLRVFVSSTYYDLKHIRSSLELMIEGMGHEAILSERGNVMFDPQKPLDESCYAEMQTADIAVLIVGGRYGSEISETASNKPQIEDRLRQFDSVTKREHETAIRSGIPVYTLIEKNVHAEYRTYLNNKANTNIIYAHVDSPNVFSFIESIEGLGVNNVIQSFEKSGEIERWLKEQWSGLFRDLLRRRQQNEEVVTLANQVARLSDAGKTLEKYLEDVLRSIEPQKAASIISEEHTRRNERLRASVIASPSIDLVARVCGMSPDLALDTLLQSSNEEDFSKLLEQNKSDSNRNVEDITNFMHKSKAFLQDLNDIRDSFGLPNLVIETRSSERTSNESSVIPKRLRRRE